MQILRGANSLIITAQVEVDGFCTEKKEILIHNSLNISDLAGAVKKWLDEILPKSTGHVGFSMTHRGSILKETSSLVDCGIDKDSKVFVTLKFKPLVSNEPLGGVDQTHSAEASCPMSL